jgi:serine/threonine protein kinase
MVRPAVASNDADQQAATRTLAASGDNAAERTQKSDDANTATGGRSAEQPAGAFTSPPSGSGRPRLPAPLQYRDPDRYEVLAEHGRGGIGRVMRARDRELGRSVAIKELLVSRQSSELRFFREAMITARLEHPGIVPVHEAGRWPDGTPFYAMKLVAGRPLTSLIDDAKTSEQRLALIPHVIAVADAVSYAHSKGIIHRDLKPANIIVGEFGETVVIDWGLAKQLGSAEDLTPPVRAPGHIHKGDGQLTVAGSVLGTPAYMPPEQAAGTDVDERADIFALGGVLLHILTGLVPVKDTAGVGSVAKLQSELRAIVDRAMSPLATDRYPSVRDFASDLRAFQVGRRVSAYDYQLRELLGRWINKHRVVLGIALLAAVIVATTVVFAARNTSRERGVAARLKAESQQGSEQLMLARARLLLSKDPSRSHQVSEQIPYSATSAQSLALLKADALGRGVAQSSFTPSPRRIRNLHWTSTDSLVLDSMMDVWSVVDLRSKVASTEVGRAGTSVLAVDAARRQLIYQAPDTTVYLRALDSQRDAALGSVAGAVWDATFSPSGSLVAATTNSGDIVIWHLPTASKHTWRRARGVYHSVRFSPDSSLLATCGRDGVLVVWSVKTHRVVAKATCDGLANVDYAIIPGNKTLVIGTRTGATHLYNIDPDRSGTVSQKAAGPQLTGTVLDVSEHIDSSALLVTSSGEVVQYRPDTNSIIWKTRVGGEVTRVAQATELGLILVGRRDGVVSVLGNSGEYVAELRCGDTVTGLSVSPDGRQLATATADGSIKLWSLPPRSATSRPLSAAPLFTVRFSPDGTRLGVDSQDGYIYVCAVGDWKCRAVTKHESLANGLAWSADGQTLASSGWDGMIRFWTSDGGTRSMRVDGPGPITLYDWAANGRIATLLRRNLGWEVADISQPIAGLRRIASFASDASLSISGDGTRLTLVESNGRLSAFVANELASLHPYATVELGAKSAVPPLVVPSWTGHRVFVDLGRRKRFVVTMSELRPPSASRVVDRDAALASAVFTRVEDYIALAYEDGLVDIVKLGGGRYSAQPFPYAPVSVMASEHQVVAVDAEGMLWAFDIAQAAHCVTHLIAAGRITAAALSPDSAIVAAVSDSGHLYTFPLKNCHWAEERPSTNQR